jgi:hypothetical protein
MELIHKLADRIEQELRDAISTEPYPFYTNMEDACDFCYQFTIREEIRIVIDPRYGYFVEVKACWDCIHGNQLKISDTERALDYEARTIAIRRIRHSTTLENLELWKGGE